MDKYLYDIYWKNTSMIPTVFSGFVGCKYFGIITDSKLFQGIVVFPFIISEMISLVVSDPS